MAIHSFVPSMWVCMYMCVSVLGSTPNSKLNTWPPLSSMKVTNPLASEQQARYVPEIAAMESHNVWVFALSQNSYLLLDNVEVITCVCVCAGT